MKPTIMVVAASAVLLALTSVDVRGEAIAKKFSSTQQWNTTTENTTSTENNPSSLTNVEFTVSSPGQIDTFSGFSSPNKPAVFSIIQQET
jgi:hypothetical protein